MTLKNFSDLVVVELGGSFAGGYAGKLLADRGAQVTLVDPKPPPLDTDHAAWHFLHGNKAVAAELGSLADNADLVIESSAPEPLQAVVAARKGLVRLHVSPHGATGVYADFLSTDLTDYALSGHQYLYGDPDRHPLPGPPNQPAIAAGLFGCAGALAALLTIGLTGGGSKGTLVETSHVEVMAALHQFTLVRSQFGGDVLCRMGNRFTGQGQPNTVYPCADGFVSITCVTDQQIESLLEVTGLGHILELPEISSPQDVQLHPHLVDEGLIPWLAERNRDEIVELLQAMRIPTCPSLPMLDLLNDVQLADRQWWAAGPDENRIPGPPVRLSHHGWSGGATPTGESASPVGPGPMANRVGFGSDRGSGPLAGLRVLDLTRVWAGPLAARTLADLGAEVVMVEAPWNRGPQVIPQSIVEVTRVYPDNELGERHWNRNGHLNKYAMTKQSVVLDLTRPEGVAAFERLAAGFDVVIENYSPRVMPQFGLGDDRIHELNPDAIVVTMPGYGRTGPARDWVAYGSCLDSHAGLSTLTGYQDASPWKGGIAWPDPIAGLHAVGAMLISLWDRAAGTTRGQTVEVAQLECIVNAVGDQVLAAQLRGENPVPLGGRHQTEAPHGVYPCLGTDRWVSISVATDEQWQRLIGLAGLDSSWASWSESERKEQHDVIDSAISRWTATHDHMLAMYRLQELGIAAGAVLDAPEVLADPQFNSRALMETLDQPDVGLMTLTRTPIRMNGRYPDLQPAPGLGEHNDSVLGRAGFAAHERQELRSLGVVADEPPG